MVKNIGSNFIVLKFRSRRDFRTAWEIARVNNIKVNQVVPEAEFQISIPCDRLGPFQSSGFIIDGFEVRPWQKF